MINNQLQPHPGVLTTNYNQFRKVDNQLQSHPRALTTNYNDLYDHLHPFTTAITINYNYFCDIYNSYYNQLQ
jgi:hypothetical protein